MLPTFQVDIFETFVFNVYLNRPKELEQLSLAVDVDLMFLESDINKWVMRKG